MSTCRAERSTVTEMEPMIVLAGTAEFATKEGRDACLSTSGQRFTRFDFLQGDFKKYRVDKVGPVYDATFTPRANFF